MLCFGLLVMLCEPPKQVAVDSYCQAYQKVIRTPADSAIQGTLGAKQRLAANEITFRCTCEKWQSPLCRTKSK